MKKYYARNVRKAIEQTLAVYDSVTLNLISGMDGTIITQRQYKTVNGLLRNSGRRVSCFFHYWPDSRVSNFPRFFATY